MSLRDGSLGSETVNSDRPLEVIIQATDGNLTSASRSIQIAFEAEENNDINNVNLFERVDNPSSQPSIADDDSVSNPVEDDPQFVTDIERLAQTPPTRLADGTTPTRTPASQPNDITGLAAVADLNLNDEETIFGLSSDSVSYLFQSNAQGVQLVTQELGDIIDSRRGDDVKLDESLLAKYFWQGFDDSEDAFIRKNLKVDTAAIVAVPAGLTLGLVSYMRMAAMATSVVTQLPTWKTLDVAPLITAFDEEEAETIHQIVDE